MNLSPYELSLYNFYLPPELIAERPAMVRDHSKLLVYDQASGEVAHARFDQLPSFLHSGDHLVLNQTKVVSCRILAHKKSGGQAEIFVLSWEDGKRTHECLIKASGTRKIGEEFVLPQNVVATLASPLPIEGGIFQVTFSCSSLKAFLQEHGRMPIPPYIRKGQSDERDISDYQTVYGRELGSVAAPTAGLHFTEQILKQLSDKQIKQNFLTLHVGRGTFAPIKTSDLREHRMHMESFSVAPTVATQINDDWGKLIAVGTTSLRALEALATTEGNLSSHAHDGQWKQTDIFLYPGKKIHSIKGLITNFHLPQSSLFILVCALIGREKALELYELAIKNKYRFFSYGDAMFIRIRPDHV